MKYILNECQFMTLLALAGAEKVYTFRMEEKFPAEDVISAVSCLYKIGVLEECEGRFTLSQPVSRWIEALKQSKRVISIQCETGERAQYLLYPCEDGKVVVLSNTGGYERVVKLSCEDRDALLADLRENEILPASFVKNRADAEELERAAGKEIAEAQGTVLVSIRAVESVSGCAEETWEVLSSPVLRLLRVKGGGGEYTHLYAADELAALLDKSLKGESS